MVFRTLIPFNRGGLSRFGDDSHSFLSLRQDMDRLFDEFMRGWNLLATQNADFLNPTVEVSETEKGLEVHAELPGVDQKDISIELTDDVLTLKAERKSEKQEKDEKKKYYVTERSYGTFMRRFQLPFEADEGNISASFDKGVLKVFIPRSADSKPKSRKIEVQGK